MLSLFSSYLLQHNPIKPRPAFLPVLRMLGGVIEFDETRGLLVTEHWCDRNRRATGPLSPTLTLFLAPHGKLYLKLQQVLAQLQVDVNIPIIPWQENGQVLQNRNMVFLRRNGRMWCDGLLKIKNRFARWHMSMVCHVRQYDVPCWLPTRAGCEMGNFLVKRRGFTKTVKNGENLFGRELEESIVEHKNGSLFHIRILNSSRLYC